MIIVLFLFLPVLYLSSISFELFYSEICRLIAKYLDEVLIQSIEQTINGTPWGLGTGMNKGPARHEFEDPGVFQLIEN